MSEQTAAASRPERIFEDDALEQRRRDMLGIDLILSAVYPAGTAWRIYRDGCEIGVVTASGPLSALVCAGRAMPSYEPCNGEWEVERVA